MLLDAAFDARNRMAIVVIVHNNASQVPAPSTSAIIGPGWPWWLSALAVSIGHRHWQASGQPWLPCASARTRIAMESISIGKDQDDGKLSATMDNGQHIISSSSNSNNQPHGMSRNNQPQVPAPGTTASALASASAVAIGISIGRIHRHRP